jgi:hypothetical protein
MDPSGQTRLWKRLDAAEHPPRFIALGDCCYFAREYVSKGDVRDYPTNSLIQNFKKPPDRKGKPEWKYKQDAIRQFARELSDLLPDGAVIAHVPTSRPPTSPQYDSRFEEAFAVLRRHRPSIVFDQPISIRRDLGSAHAGELARSPDLIARNLDWKGFLRVPERLFIVDDVVTSAAHFAAFRDLVREHHADIDLIGVFWARCIRKDEIEVVP